MIRVLALILAGGKGVRLEPLTRDRAKPAVPFGGAYRIIDFTLSNCINSGLRRMLVLTQYKAASLDRHIQMGWRFLCRELDEFIDILPPQQRIDEHWYQGTADAVYQNIYSIERSDPDYVVILSGDHIYKMDYAELLREHMQTEADVTIGCIPVPLSESDQFGIMRIDSQNRVTDFLEKPKHADPMPGDPTRCLASMGIYVFNANFLFEQLCRDATQPDSQHDFGKNIIPAAIEKYKVQAYIFQGYWEDIGTIGAFFEANLNLTDSNPKFSFSGDGAVYTNPRFLPASIVRSSQIDRSLIADGCTIELAGLHQRVAHSPQPLQEARHRPLIPQGAAVRNQLLR
jgi:glucose-1-phosphate adenylyltransferase